MQKSAGMLTVCLIAGGLLLASCSSSQSPAPTPVTDRTTTHEPARGATAQRVANTPPYFESADAARPFPQLVPVSYFRGYPLAARAYRIAEESPGVLAQQPCLCHCEKSGHRSLLDCYASEHASNCLICIKETLLTEQMTKQGKTAAEIREAVIRSDWRDLRIQ